jgi:hypothetical protein
MNWLNPFVRHHQNWLPFGYRCFDRILLRGAIPVFHSLGMVVNFLKGRRQAQALTPAYFRQISSDFHQAVTTQAQQQGIPIVEPPREVRRAEWVEPYFQALGTRPGAAVLLKCTERARVIVSYPRQGNHLDWAWRYVKVYYVYQQDPALGRLFLRLCPYFPFPLTACVNGHEWLAQQLRGEGIPFRQRANAFTDCAEPQRLQALADAFSPEQLRQALEPLLEQGLPFFTPAQRAQGYRHQWYMAQVEYGHNLVFQERARAARLFDRRLDLNRTIGCPERLAVIFARPSFHADTGTAQTEVKITRLRLPVLNAGFQQTSLKQYLKEGAVLRTETSCFQLQHLSLPKEISNLPKVREVFSRSKERYLTAQQDVLSTYLDRGQLRALAQPTVSASGRRTPRVAAGRPSLAGPAAGVDVPGASGRPGHLQDGAVVGRHAAVLGASGLPAQPVALRSGQATGQGVGGTSAGNATVSTDGGGIPARGVV